MYICQKCGEHYKGDYGKCGKCGGDIALDSSAPSPNMTIIPVQQTRRWLKLAVFLSLSVIAALLAFLYFSRHDLVVKPLQIMDHSSPHWAAKRTNAQGYFEKFFLIQGYEVQIRFEGPANDELRIRHGSMSREIVSHWETKTLLKKDLQDLHFKKVYFETDRGVPVEAWFL